MVYWKAIYSDETCFNQYNEDGSENLYKDIDRTKLDCFILMNEEKTILVIHLDDKKKLICRRRIAIGLDNNIQHVVWIAGWQENRQGMNVQMVCFVFDDGHIEVLDRFKENHRWFYSIKFMKEEEIMHGGDKS